MLLNISPCPNDTFMFDALINSRIDTRGYSFEVNYFDIEELNRRVMQGEPAISKISYAVLPAIDATYAVFDSGSALGHGNGPLLVARNAAAIHEYLSDCLSSVSADGTKGSRLLSSFRAAPRVAVPGLHTTANLLLQRLFPSLADRTPVLFSDIAPAIAEGEFDAGVLIHEGRFTYREHDLELVADLGVEWGRATLGLPLPLGAIVASRSLPPEAVKTVEELIRESVEYAFAHPEVSRKFVKEHAREMDDDVIDSHIALFVNENSLSLSSDARRAVKELTGVTI